MTERETIQHFALYDPHHAGCEYRIYDGDELVAYVQWTQWNNYIEIDSIESLTPGYGSQLVAMLQERHNTIVLTSIWNAKGFWAAMGFKQCIDDKHQFIWKRGTG